MFFQQVADGGCQSYVIGCAESCAAAIIDPALGQIDRYVGIANREGLRVRYIIETHTHADHFSAARQLAERMGATVVMHRNSPAPHVAMRVDDGHLIAVGALRLKVMHTPGHTRDSMCLHVDDRVFTGDTLLIGGTGRTDLPTGDPAELHRSLFARLLLLDRETLVFPAHDYKGRTHSSIGTEIDGNPRLQVRDEAAFIEMMRGLNLSAPTHLTEALRTNMSGGKTVRQLLAEAALGVPFVSLEGLAGRLEGKRNDFVILDVRERDAYARGHIPGALHLARGQLELKVDETFPDPNLEILTVCELGKISTLAAATLRELGFGRAVALDGGMKSWREGGFPMETGEDPALLI
ncbi:Glyoxylase, beta-lactamase superfamily II [Sphingomonas laterariae]|uniref:Glyoxylase, beta-lactamase superfamily II n=1 Tax=Edaphosphingomonas laterariae TaxID=861865 RepID=A0A239BLD0_9SPHN|nr:MBL fold metallo-hydrolase [Sphingomonas laterariae]SNS08676.1 Glyoxylase, beta-lactamase superfamily II [Sphingomonas laterariae]